MKHSLLSRLRCPLNGDALTHEGNGLVSTMGEYYPIIHGVPVLLTKTEDPTHWVLSASCDAARNGPDDIYYEDTVGIVPDELAELKERLNSGLTDSVDPIVSFLVGATSGNMYRDLIGKLETIPIPEFRMPSGNGMMLEIGCSWGAGLSLQPKTAIQWLASTPRPARCLRQSD